MTPLEKGLTDLTKSCAIESVPYGVRVVSIHPTGVNMPMNDGLAVLEGKTLKKSRKCPPAVCCLCLGLRLRM